MQGGTKTFKCLKGKSYSYKFTGNEQLGDTIAVEVGPIWSHNEFLKRKNEWASMIPGWSMTGHWWTTIPCSMSVVQFKMQDVKIEMAKKQEPSKQQQNQLGFVDYPEEPKKELIKSKFANIPVTPEDELYICPISQCIMEDPVITSSGHTFERAFIQKWLNKNEHCPITKKKINKDLVSNFALKAIIEAKFGDIKQNQEVRVEKEVKYEPEFCYIALAGRDDYVFDAPYFQNKTKMDIFYRKKPNQNNKNQLFYKEKINDMEFHIFSKPQDDICELT